MWVLTTHQRPEMCQAVLNACAKCEMKSPLVIWIDYGSEYKGLKVPRNTAHVWRAAQWGSLGQAFRAVRGKYPNEKTYGWLSDDTFPETPHFDEILEREAGDWFVSYAADKWLSEDEENVSSLRDGRILSSGVCWGGELVRAVGYWVLPGTFQAGSDTAWCKIIEPLKLARYCPEVVVEHAHYKNNRRPPDASDSWIKDNVNYVQHDLDTHVEWDECGERDRAIARVRAAMRKRLGGKRNA